MPRVLLILPTSTYRAPDFLAAARALGAEVVVASEHRQALSGSMGLSQLRGVIQSPWMKRMVPVESAMVAPLLEGGSTRRYARTGSARIDQMTALIRAAWGEDRFEDALRRAGRSPTPLWPPNRPATALGEERASRLTLTTRSLGTSFGRPARHVASSRIRGESGSWRRVDWDDRRSSGAAVIRSRAET